MADLAIRNPPRPTQPEEIRCGVLDCNWLVMAQVTQTKRGMRGCRADNNL